MKKTRLASLAALTLAVPLLLTGCFGQNQLPQANPSTSAPAGTLSNPAGTSAPSSTDNPTPTGTLDLGDPYTAAGQKATSANLFPDVKATGKFSKQDVQLALFTAYQYAQLSQNSSVLLSGKWAQTGFSDGVFRGLFQNLFTIDAFAELNTSLKALPDDEATVNNIFSTATYFNAATSNFKTCAITATNCQVAGYPTYKNYSYNLNGEDQDRLEVKLTADSRITMTKDGKAGYYPLTNDMDLIIVKNPSYTGQTGSFPYVISGVHNHVKSAGFVAN